jgi:hypothetical protein
VRAGVELSNRLLKSHTYDGKGAGEFFQIVYDIRSTIVHNGSYGQISDEDFKQLFRDCKKFVGDLLVAYALENGHGSSAL